MSILFSVLAVLAAPHANDRAFDAPADRSDLATHEGSPVWVLMARCAKWSYQEAQDLDQIPLTATYEARAKSYNMTAAEMLEAEKTAAMNGVRRYLTIAMEGLSADRGIEIEDARGFMTEQLAEAEPMESDIFGSPCPAIANAIAPE